MAERSSSATIGLAVVVVIIIIAAAAAAYFLYFREEGGEGGGGGGTGTINLPPIAKISTNWTTNTRVNDMIEFNATESSDPDGLIVLYTWNFGDLTKEIVGGNLVVVNHSYSFPGTYTVNLTIRDDSGNVDSTEVTVTIRQSDTHDSDNGAISANEQIPLEANVTFSFKVDDGAKNVNIVLTLTGGSSDSNDEFASKIDIIIRDPIYQVMENRSTSVRGFQNESFTFFYYELTFPGNYFVDLRCYTGSTFVQFEVDVFY